MTKKKHTIKIKKISIIIAIIVLSLCNTALIYQNINLNKLNQEQKAVIGLQSDKIYNYMDEIDELNSELDLSLAENIYLELNGYLEYEVPIWKINDFLLGIGINDHEYIEDKYNCVDFTNQMINDLREAGYYSCMGYLILEDEYAHALVAVMTDEGILYIEPQDNSNTLNILPGDYYWGDKITAIKSCFGNAY